MKKVALFLCLGIFLTVSCEQKEQEYQVSSVSITPCQQTKAANNELSERVVVEFINSGVQITHYNFAVTCDFTTVNVTHTFVNGVLNITQQGSPDQAKCICYTDVSYTINEILKNEVNVIFINGVQVYCYNDNNDCTIDLKTGEVIEIKSGETACNAQYGLSLRVENVNDSRCPEGGICFWAGYVPVKFNLATKKGQYDFTLEPRSIIFKNDTVIEGIKYQLKDVLPYPVVGEDQSVKTIRILADHNKGVSNCDQDVIISKSEYDNAPNAPVSILDMKIEGNCLKIKLATSSWCGNRNSVKLIDSGEVTYSIAAVYPPLHHRTLRLSRYLDACASAVAIEISFNIEDLQVQGLNGIYLHISGQKIFYQY